MATRVRVALANFNPIWFVAVVRLLLAFLVFWLAAPHDAICAPKEIRPPPVGERITAQVMRGGSTIVTLKAFEGRGNPLEYTIVGKPRHGRLEDFRQADGNRQGFASVTYVHGDDEESLEDEFAFRARALVGGGVSSPIKVSMRIVDAPPRLQVTPAAEFSAVAGESDRQQIILVNEGGGLIEGRIAPKEPFHVEGEGRFALGRGQMTNVIIRFSPQSVKAVAPQRITPAPADPGAVVALRAETLAPFVAEANPLQVQSNGFRTGTILVGNQSLSPVTVDLTLAPGAAADIPPRADIPGQGKAEIPVTIGPDKTGGSEELKIAVSSPFHRQELTVPVPAVPPRLELITPELDFRKVNEAELIVRNTGGLDGRFSLQLPANIKSIEGAASFVVQPGSERKVPLRHEKRASADAAETLLVELGTTNRLPVTLLFAEAAQPPPPPPPPPTPPPPPPKERIWQLNTDIKVVQGSAKPAVIAWLDSKDKWTDAQLERVSPEGVRTFDGRGERTKNEPFLFGWWHGFFESVRLAWVRFRTGLEGKKIEQIDENWTAQAADTEWRETEIPDGDLDNTGVRWRVTAIGSGRKEREQVSDDFQTRGTGGRLVAWVPSITEPPPGKSGGDDLGSWVRVIGRTADAGGLTLTLAQPWQSDLADLRLEEIVGMQVAENGPPAYETRAPQAGEGKILTTGDYLAAGGRELRTIKIRFEKMPRGGSKLFRLVSRSEQGKETFSEPFSVEGDMRASFPWRKILLAAFAAILLLIWREIRKNRNA